MTMKILEVKIVKANAENVIARADVHFEGWGVPRIVRTYSTIH